jgi:competence protein CoiA
MKYALASGQRAEAFIGGRGLCPTCSREVIAKCGSHRIPHWAHQGIRDCDSWAEKETEWHRAWKNHFPAECQEFIQHGEKSGEKHIADVRTEHGLVIEFQHSHLDPQERAARERFYGNMVWVVDGTRLRRDYPRFSKGKDGLRRTNNQGYFLLTFPDECFPLMWLDSSVPVIFDFQGIEENRSPDVFRDTLWCLLPGRAERDAVVVGMSREDFVKVAPSRPHLLPVQDILTGFAQRIRELRAAENAFAAQQSYRRFAGRVQRRHRRF